MGSLSFLVLIVCTLSSWSGSVADLYEAISSVYADKGWASSFPGEDDYWAPKPAQQPNHRKLAAAEGGWGSGDGYVVRRGDSNDLYELQAAREIPEQTPANLHPGIPYDRSMFERALANPERPMLRHCMVARGSWCGKFERQQPIPSRPAPRGKRDCRKNCNGVGNCNHDSGLCECPAGAKGKDCSVPDLRPCTNETRSEHDPPDMVPKSHIDQHGRDINHADPGWTASRCAGICDPNTAQCYCDSQTYKQAARINAPPGSPPGTPAVQRGRPIADSCNKLGLTKDGVKTNWGQNNWDALYGKQGYCEVKNLHDASINCGCAYEGISGPNCDIATEVFCLNQCSGNGDCWQGFCKCHKGWYGADCSRRRAGEPFTKPTNVPPSKPYLQNVVAPVPAAEDPPSKPTRKRPLIYVYDMPPALTTRMLQYKNTRHTCIWRAFEADNSSRVHDWIYGVELYLHEHLLISEHRTFDPEEADFFYVPVYITCYFWPIMGWADHPWWHHSKGIRPMHGANMMLEAKRFIDSNFPYWKRRGGRDHIWLIAADEGACWAPTEIYNVSIMLTHWGRLDPDHKSNSAYALDIYDSGFSPTGKPEDDWRVPIKGHPCYRPDKDLVIPSLKPPGHYRASPLLGAMPVERDILLYFRGDMGLRRDAHYSRGIRQAIMRHSFKNRWADKYRVVVGESHMISGGAYSEHLARSKFCLVLPGDGWSARMEDSVLHGCIPVIIMDQVHAVFESILDVDSFSVRVPEKSLAHLPKLLVAISDDQYARMQRRLSQVWHRFAFAQGRLYQSEIEALTKSNFQRRGGKQPYPDYPLQPVTNFPQEHDAFSTIMQWLYAKIDDVKGKS